MEIEVAVPVHASEFKVDSTDSSPYITAPSSPIRFGNLFFSAPTSPSRSNPSNTSQDFNSSSSALLDWEENPGTPRNRASDFGEDFEFDFSGQLEKFDFLAADELFQGGKIRPLKPPPGYDDQTSRVSSPKSPNSRVPRRNDFDQFEKPKEKTQTRQESGKGPRGRERSAGSYVHKGSRSLSPLRVSDIMLETEEFSPSPKLVASPASNPKPSISSSIFSALSFSGRSHKKWKLKDLLLFRSASEGRATATSTKDSLRGYDVQPKKRETEEVKNQSFRYGESVGSSSVSGTGSRRRGGVPVKVSAHELHYTANRAVSEELKRKTFLPYNPGWLGCLGFNPGLRDISRVGSLPRGGS